MQAKTLTGVLNFYTWFSPWILISETGERYDFSIDVKDLFKRLNGKSVTFSEKGQAFSLGVDELSEWTFLFEQTEKTVVAVLNKKIGIGGSNVIAYIPEIFQRINGRRVITTITDTYIEFTVDPEEKVFTLPYTGDGNSASIPKGKEKEICKAGTSQSCIFCSFSSKQEWTCLKGDPYWGRQLLYRVDKEDMRSTRIGNCLITGRTE